MFFVRAKKQGGGWGGKGTSGDSQRLEFTTPSLNPILFSDGPFMATVHVFHSFSNGGTRLKSPNLFLVFSRLNGRSCDRVEEAHAKPWLQFWRMLVAIGRDFVGCCSQAPRCQQETLRRGFERVRKIAAGAAILEQLQGACQTRPQRFGRDDLRKRAALQKCAASLRRSSPPTESLWILVHAPQEIRRIGFAKCFHSKLLIEPAETHAL